jgi:hypothetical protein
MSSVKRHHNFIKSNHINLSEINTYTMKSKISKNISSNIKLSVCIHFFNLNIFRELIFYIYNLFEFKWKRIQIIIHYINQELKMIETIIENVFQNKLTMDMCDSFIFIQGENIGVDIGGFLKCLDYIKDDDDYIIKIHTKSNDIWRRQMMNIFSEKGIFNCIRLLKNKKIGMVGSGYNIEHFRKKYNHGFKVNGQYIPMIQRMCNTMKFPFNSKNLIESYFVAGTIFICKRSLLKPVINYRKYLYSLCLDLRKSEWKTGKMSGTYEHAMEIMFGYIPFQMNRKLVGLY